MILNLFIYMQFFMTGIPPTTGEYRSIGFFLKN